MRKLRFILAAACCALILLLAGCSSQPVPSALVRASDGASTVSASVYPSGTFYHSDLGYAFLYPSSWDAEGEEIQVQKTHTNVADEESFFCTEIPDHPLLIVGRTSPANWEAGKIHSSDDYVLLELAQSGNQFYYAKVARSSLTATSGADLYNSMLLPQSEVKARFTIEEESEAA